MNVACAFSRVDLTALRVASDPINLAGSGPTPIEPRPELELSERQEQLVTKLWDMLGGELLSDGISSLVAVTALAIEHSTPDPDRKGAMVDECCRMLEETAEAVRRGALVRHGGTPIGLGGAT